MKKRMKHRLRLSRLLLVTVFLVGVLFSVPALADDPDPTEDTLETSEGSTATEVDTFAKEVLPFDPSTTSDSELSSGDDILGIGSNDPITVAIRITNVILTLLGITFLVTLIYGGTTWVLARGNTEEIERAKKMIRRGLIGFIIILSAYGIANLLFDLVATAGSGTSFT